MLDGLSGASASRSTSVRSAVLVVGVAVVALGVVIGAGLLFGVLPGSSASRSSAAATAEALDPAPTLSCAGATGGAGSAVTATVTGTASQDTPLAATEQWLSTLANHAVMVEARQFAGPSGRTDSRTIGWYDHDGTLRATAVVVPVAGGGWQLIDAASCS